MSSPPTLEQQLLNLAEKLRDENGYLTSDSHLCQVAAHSLVTNDNAITSLQAALEHYRDGDPIKRDQQRTVAIQNLCDNLNSITPHLIWALHRHNNPPPPVSIWYRIRKMIGL